MKIILAILLATSLFSNVKVIEKQQVNFSNNSVQIICMDRKKFLIVSKGNAVSVIQIFKKFNSFGNPPIPEEC